MHLLIDAIIQIIILTIIPCIWWAIIDRKHSGFFNWLGLKKPRVKNKQKYAISFSLMTFMSIIPIFIVFPLLTNTTEIVTSQFAGQGVSALIPALIWSFFQTGLSEEIFFRGFVAKRLINKFGFEIGNVIQGLLFGLMHGIFFISVTGVLWAVIIVTFTGVSGWLSGWINEKLSDGSIVSSWLLHGMGNIIASIAAMYNLV